MSKSNERYELGQRVVVTQQIPQRTRVWTVRLEGDVVKFEQGKPGSWFAHSKDDRLWLDRLTIRKDDGELVVCTLDAYSHVRVVPTPAGQEASNPPKAKNDEPAEQTDESPDGDGHKSADTETKDSKSKEAKPSANAASKAGV